METSPLFARTFDFLSWLLPRTESFPRSQRFAVTQRLQNAALDFQEIIVEAETARGAPNGRANIKKARASPSHGPARADCFSKYAEPDFSRSARKFSFIARAYSRLNSRRPSLPRLQM